MSSGKKCSKVLLLLSGAAIIEVEQDRIEPIDVCALGFPAAVKISWCRLRGYEASSQPSLPASCSREIAQGHSDPEEKFFPLPIGDEPCLNLSHGRQIHSRWQHGPRCRETELDELWNHDTTILLCQITVKAAPGWS